MIKQALLLTTMIAFSLISTISASSPVEGPSPEAIIVYTTDVHGNFFPRDFIRRQPAEGSLARVANYVKQLRSRYGDDRVALLDNGDILQGQPTAYYYNFIDTTATHPADEIYRVMGYDATSVGNHDIETGHAVYDRWAAAAGIPVLAANVIDRSTGKPYFQPYTVIDRGGLKIAVIGLLSPAIPAWLPETLWAGLEFRDMEPAAREWVEIVRKQENPDLVIGLFHSGADSTKRTGDYLENASALVGAHVDGFDAILMGHDHRVCLDSVTAPSGRRIPILNPANNARNVGQLSVYRASDGRPAIKPAIVDITGYEPEPSYMAHFSHQIAEVDSFVNRQIGEFADSLVENAALFGPSSFMTLLHDLQLAISGADVSIAAPLSLGGVIAKGPARIADMFTLYKYENMLYTMLLTGQELKDYLEYSYSLWVNQITSDQPHLINFESASPTKTDNRLKNPVYNFDSAAGVRYTVDITKPAGERVTILSMADGRPFSADSVYTVAVNSYRGNGGGDHLVKGAKIPASELTSRIVSSTDKDLRYYLIRQIEQIGSIAPRTDRNWEFLPAAVALPAIAADRDLLFSNDSSREQK